MKKVARPEPRSNWRQSVWKVVVSEVLAGKHLHVIKMVLKEELLEKFQITGCDNLSDEILEKCVELCHWYDKDEEEFVDMWVAFGIGHLDGKLEPNLKALEEMKRVTPRSKNKDHDDSFKAHQDQNQKFLSASNTDTWMDEDENDILGMYATSDQLSIMQTKRPRSPDLEDSSAGGCKAQTVECSPANLETNSSSNSTTAATQLASSQSVLSKSFSTGSKVLMSYGPKLTTWTNDNKQKCVIKRAGPHVPSNARYMFELLKSKSDVLTRVCRVIGYRINSLWAEQKKDDVLVTWNVRTKHQMPYRTWGRVCFESEIKQENSMVMLEGCRKPPKSNNSDSKLWPMVQMDVSDLRECCVFPGQVVAVEGLNLTESLIKVHGMFTSCFIPAAKPPHLSQDLKLVVAAGPFTQSNDLNYQPLWELMTKVAEDEPHVLILIGPFLDYTHPEIQNEQLTCTYQEYFNRLIAKIKNHLTGKCTQVVLIASCRDIHHHAVYPTLEYFLPKSVQGPDIHVLPDPCVIDIDGLRLGITSIDCLMHLGREEVTLKPSGTDKLSRLGNYILNQACFYPLYPPAKEINIDYELWEKYAFLKEKPHMLFLPSDMRYFCKSINESVILNPERLSKRSYARINFKSTAENTWTQNNISCEIIKM